MQAQDTILNASNEDIEMASVVAEDPLLKYMSRHILDGTNIFDEKVNYGKETGGEEIDWWVERRNNLLEKYEGLSPEVADLSIIICEALVLEDIRRGKA